MIAQLARAAAAGAGLGLIAGAGVVQILAFQAKRRYGRH